MVVVLDLAWGLLQENKHLLVHRPEASLPIQNNTYALSYMLSHTKLSAAGSILHLLRVPNNLYVRVPAPNEHPVKRYNAVNEVTIVRNVMFLFAFVIRFAYHYFRLLVGAVVGNEDNPHSPPGIRSKKPAELFE